MDPSKCVDMFLVHGSFLVFDENHARRLREKRIIGQPVGCSPRKPYQIITSGLPFQYSHSAAIYACQNGLATLKRLHYNQKSSISDKEKKFKACFDVIKQNAFRDFEIKQKEESAKREIEISAQVISSKFHEKRVKVMIDSKPNTDFSSSVAVPIDQIELETIFRPHATRYAVYRDLYERGFYVSSGINFGCDFLAYPNDPIIYHAKYAIRIVHSKENLVDFMSINYGEINALHRLCHTAKKIILLAVLQDDSTVKYWTLKTREYITPKSSDAMELINPRP